LGTVYSISSAIKWFESTFFYVRIFRNPGHYGINVENNMSIKASVETLFRREFKSLVENQAVEQEENNPGNYGATEYGKAMSRFYIIEYVESFLGK
jgi:replicative superfamily II helicase